MRVARSPESPSVQIAPDPGAGRALELFSEDLLQHVLIEGEISHKLLEFAILLFPLAQSPQLGDAHTSELAFPAVERLLADAELAAHLGYHCPGLDLA
jgi:hypothetical protein